MNLGSLSELDELNQKTTVFFVRHGHVWNPLNLFYGRLLGFPISELGRKQALNAAHYLRDKSIDAIYSSPQLRACETAQIILKPHNHLILRISDLINEVHSPFDGQAFEEVAERDMDLYTGVGPEFEQPKDVISRARKFLSSIRIGHCGQNIVAVSHGDLIAFLILWANGLTFTTANKQKLYQGYLKPGSIFIFEFDTLEEDEIPRLKYVKGPEMNEDEITLDSGGTDAHGPDGRG